MLQRTFPRFYTDSLSSTFHNEAKMFLKEHCSFSGWGQNCPHPEKPFSNSKTISQIKFPYRIEKLVKSQQEWPGGKTLCRSLVTCKGFFCPVVLLLLLCENGYLIVMRVRTRLRIESSRFCKPLFAGFDSQN